MGNRGGKEHRQEQGLQTEVIANLEIQLRGIPGIIKQIDRKILSNHPVNIPGSLHYNYWSMNYSEKRIGI